MNATDAADATDATVACPSCGGGEWTASILDEVMAYYRFDAESGEWIAESAAVTDRLVSIVYQCHACADEWDATDEAVAGLPELKWPADE